MKPDVTLAFDRSLLRVGERVCCALSGGADSVAMLLLVLELNARKDSLGVGLSAAHVHHGLRGVAADEDEAFVRELCTRLGVPLQVFRVDTPARQAATGEGLEEAARELRYEALRGLLASRVADAVATAHTLDDQAETVMLKLLRGAWTEGLGGISPVLEGEGAGQGTPGVELGRTGGGRFVRPLLGVRRTEVEAFLQSRGQTWREDASNADVRWTRNRVRHELMPVLRTYNPAVDELLARTAEVARDEEAFWERETARLLPPLLLPGKPVRGGGRAVSTMVGERSLAVEIARLKVLGPAVQRRLLRAAARQLGSRLNAEETARLMALAGFGAHATVSARVGARLELRDGLRAERSARELRLWNRFGAEEKSVKEK